MKSRVRALISSVVGLLLATSIASARDGSPATISLAAHVAPTVTGVSPTGGPTAGGTTVIITGSGFQQGGDPVLAVNFGVTGADFTVNSDTQITATSPAAVPGTVDIRVGNSLQSATVAGDRFTYFLPPQVNSVSPNSGAQAGGTPVTISGSDFTGATDVRFGATILTTGFTVVNNTTITTTTPAGTGTVVVRVTTPGGTDLFSSASFTYLATPTVTSISPNHATAAGGTDVTIGGTGFSGVTSVTIGGAAATSVTVVNATTITAKTPAGTAGATASVRVTTPGGTNAANTLFSYDAAAPTVTSIAPNHGPAGGSTDVTITGTGLTGATAVTIGGTAATSVVVTGATTITAKTPAGTAGAAASVLVTTPGGTNAANTLYTYDAAVPAPTVTGVSPATVPANTAFAVTLSGTNFGSRNSDITSVQYGPTSGNGIDFAASSATWVDATHITATLGTNVNAGAVMKFVVTINNQPSAPSSVTVTGIPTITGVGSPAGFVAGTVPARTAAAVTLTGTGFTFGSTVTYGAAGTGSSAAVQFFSSTQINATTGADIDSGSAVKFIVTASGQPSAPSTAVVGVPTITAISPSTVPAGTATTVTITGTGFTPTATVTYGPNGTGTNAAIVGTPTANTILTSVTLAASVVAKLIVTSNFQASPVSIATVTGVAPPTSPPTITGINPTFGPAAGGTTVVITGTNFTGVSAVTFGGNIAPLISSTNSTVTVTSPPGTSKVDVIVTTPGGTSELSGRPEFTYKPLPSLTNVSVTPGTAGVANTITLSGTGFGTASSDLTSVKIGTAVVSSTWGSTTSVTAVAASTLPAGTYDVTITTTGGVSTKVNAFTLTPAPGAPTIQSINPEAFPVAGGTSVVITGSNFVGVTAVSFGGIPAASFSASNSTTTSMTAVSPPGSANAAGVITVSAAGGQAASSNPVTWCGTPTVSSVSPPSVAVGGAVTVTGTNFCPKSTVVQLINVSSQLSVNQSTTFISQFQVMFVASLNSTLTSTGFGRTRGARVMAAVGGIQVFVLGPGGTSPPAPGVTLTITPAPAVTNVNPATGPTIGGTVVTITGTDFSGASAVRFGSVAASTFTVVSDSSIIATSPANAAGTVDILVVTASGTSTATAADRFVYAITVPTMGEWFTLLLAIMLGAAGYLSVRRRTRAERS